MWECNKTENLLIRSIMASQPSSRRAHLTKMEDSGYLLLMTCMGLMLVGFQLVLSNTIQEKDYKCTVL